MPVGAWTLAWTKPARLCARHAEVAGQTRVREVEMLTPAAPVFAANEEEVLDGPRAGRTPAQERCARNHQRLSASVSEL